MAERKVISVFGSSAPEPGSVVYETARATGRLLAEAGYAVATGGYGGVMAGVSQGAAEAGGHVIGVTSAPIDAIRPAGPNRWVNERVHFDTLRERLLHLVTVNDGMIALPGGIGTISEMTLAWSFVQVGEIPERPLVLVGDLWQRTVSAFVLPEFVRPEHHRLLLFAADAAAAVAKSRERCGDHASSSWAVRC